MGEKFIDNTNQIQDTDKKHVQAFFPFHQKHMDHHVHEKQNARISLLFRQLQLL